MLLVTSEHLAGTTQWWVLVAVPSTQLTSQPATAAQAGSTTIVEAKAVEARKGDGRGTDATRERETETGSITQTAQEIETGIVVATGTESTRNRGGPASHLFMSIS
jgi:hypothetical protein